MKKDIDKLLIKSVETYVFLLFIIFIIKLLGGNYFQMILNNRQLILIDRVLTKLNLKNIWYAISIYINVYILASISCNDNSKNMKKYILIFLPLIILFQYLKNGSYISVILDLIYPLIIIWIRLKRLNKITIKNYVFMVLFMNIIQLISITTRDNSITVAGGNFIVDFIYNLDFLLMLIILYKYFFMKGVEDICGMVVYSGSQKLISLRNLLKKSQKNLHKKRNKEEKITNAIFIPLYILWNLFTMLVIICIAKLNDAFIESIFITISFWINKRVFGKPFHFKSVYLCFCFSSIVYYILTRITLKIGTSIFIPIFLGVALSYCTSHLVEKQHKKKLYKGIPEDEFYSLIRKVTDNELTIKMCKEYYVDREKEIKVARDNGYCVESFQKKKKKVNDLIKELEI